MHLCATQLQEVSMRSPLFPCLGVALAAGAIASCTDQQVADPANTVRSTFHAEVGHPAEDCEGIGRMTGGGGQITVGGILVTRGFTIHCDITLSNNLEINWEGNRWHIDKPLTSAECFDDPAISPEPPPAPFDTFIGEGVGRLNGVDGSMVRFTFIDSGEPGGGNDQAAIAIWAPGADPDTDPPVLNVPLSFLDQGNLQAHYDQPHGSNVNR
jgi:hypothetical protein